MKLNYDILRQKRIHKQLALVQFKVSTKHAKHRFTPTNLVKEAADKAQEVGDIIVYEGIDFAKTHKWPLLGVGTLIGLFLAREPIAKFVENLREEE